MRIYAVAKGIFYFNPRPREEGDIIKIPRITSIIDFNPRPREEGDLVNML